MDIEEFVRTTLEQISANITKPINGRYVSGDTYIKEPVEFDLAVTVTENNSKVDKINGGGNIKIASVNGESANSASAKNETVSRIKFSIHIMN